MAEITTAIGDVFTSVIGMVKDVCVAIVTNPLLLFFTVLSLVGIGIGIFKRLKRA